MVVITDGVDGGLERCHSVGRVVLTVCGVVCETGDGDFHRSGGEGGENSQCFFIVQ